MLRLLCLLMFACCPLLAADPTGDATLNLETLRIEITATQADASVTVRATVHNPGEAATCEFRLPGTVAGSLKVAGIVKQADRPEHWSLQLAADQRVELAWTTRRDATLLPHLHPLGLRRLRVQLDHMLGYAAVPAQVVVTLLHPGLSAAMFPGSVDDVVRTEVPVGEQLENLEIDWHATTLTERITQLTTLRDSFDERQRTHLNRSYTGTLVHLADLYTLAADHEALAQACAQLADFEATAGHAITHCGPWARWRRHVPWTLRRLAALEAAGLDATAAAVTARDAARVIWQARALTLGKPRPFDYFDPVKYGNYWDYDWARTRALYARALELTGDAAAAKAVREAE